MTFDMHSRSFKDELSCHCFLQLTQQNVQRFSLITLSKELSIDKIENIRPRSLKATAHVRPATCIMRIFDKKVRILWIVIFVSVIIYIAIQDISPLGSLGTFFSAVWNRILETELHVERDLTKLIIYSWTR